MTFMNYPRPGLPQYAGGNPYQSQMSPHRQAMIDSLMRQRALTMSPQKGGALSALYAVQQRGAYAAPGMPPTTGAPPMAGQPPPGAFASKAAAMAAPYAGGYRPPSNGTPPGGTLQGTIPPGFGSGALSALAGGAGQGPYGSPSSAQVAPPPAGMPPGAGANFASKADAQAAPFAGGTMGTPAGGGTVSGQVPPGMGASPPFAGQGLYGSPSPGSAANNASMTQALLGAFAPAAGAPPASTSLGTPASQSVAQAAPYGGMPAAGPNPGGTVSGQVPPGMGSGPSPYGAGQGLFGDPPSSAQMGNNASMLQAQTTAFGPAGQPTTTGAASGGMTSYAAASAAPYGGMPTPAGPSGGTLTGTVPAGFGSGLSQPGQLGAGQSLYGTASPDQTANSASMLQAQLGAFAPKG